MDDNLREVDVCFGSASRKWRCVRVAMKHEGRKQRFAPSLSLDSRRRSRLLALENDNNPHTIYTQLQEISISFADLKIMVGSVDEMHNVVWREQLLEIGTQSTLSTVGLNESQNAMSLLGDPEGSDLVLVRDVVRSLSFLGLTIEG